MKINFKEVKEVTMYKEFIFTEQEARDIYYALAMYVNSTDKLGNKLPAKLLADKLEKELYQID